MKLKEGFVVFCIFSILLLSFVAAEASFEERTQQLKAQSDAQFDKNVQQIKDDYAPQKAKIDEMYNQQVNKIEAKSASAFKIISSLAIIFLILGILSLAAFVWAIVDILKAKNNTQWKAIWGIVCFVLGIIGVIIYYFVGRKERKVK